MRRRNASRSVLGELAQFARAEVDQFGVAPIARFEGAPAGAHPAELMPDCRSLLVFAMKHLDAFTLTRELACQAFSQDLTNRELQHQAYRLARFLERRGLRAFPMFASIARWPFADKEAGIAGQISLRHAAELAGLGRIGRNALLLTPEFGPRVQLGAILTDAELPGTPLLAESPCTGCELCLAHCPAQALSAPIPPAAYAPIAVEKCLDFRREQGGASPLGYRGACGLCRAVCPVGRGAREE